ncbi:MAG: hypothetical protein KJP09_11710 [Bacteroidia bacterium]|nr:hypothetical protein [Bacteroidia bacterium]MBT8308835.1 hypothetical protein [Bacteroidia bacterium]NND11922.1 hypothetical protein [Flavobacteriaceae bacterium]NNK28510.1 hypothetical protein [Flavobacteriaceae bacterium]NNL62118.1 hypothetical protein [Flavobacteriaceae bacterium]
MFVSSIIAQDKCNCCTEKHSEFDFWIGSWVVTNPDGSAAGNNVIDKIQDNCILRENWTSAKGNYTGTSSNFYNLQNKQWEQIWIDNQGQQLHLKGNRVGNKMILTSDELKNQDGESFRNRITWTHNEDGTVRQLWEILQEGKEPTIAFDGLYKRSN